MCVCLAAIAAFAFYLFAIPVKFALTVRIASHSGFGAGASIFEGRFAMRSARCRALGMKKRPDRKRKKGRLDKTAALSSALKAGKYLFGHLQLEKIRAEGRISTPDAAQTALICGCARALEGALLPCVPPRAVEFRLEPDFAAGQSDVILCGMVSVRAGHIILAALIGAWNYITGRFPHG